MSKQADTKKKTESANIVKSRGAATHQQVTLDERLLQLSRQKPTSLTLSQRNRLQRTLGNRALSRLVSEQSSVNGEQSAVNGPQPPAPNPQPLMIQPKLTVNAVGDKYEQEADAVAKEVVQKLNAPQLNAAPPHAQRQTEDEEPIAQRIQRQAAPEEEEMQLQRQELPEEEEMQLQRQELEEEDPAQLAMTQRQPQDFTHGGPVNSHIEAQINQSRGGGRPLEDSIRQPMEQAFSADFSDVRIHTDGQAHDLNEAIRARAFTTGASIFFREGEYSPSNSAGQELLAHELTHVVQQSAMKQPIVRQDFVHTQKTRTISRQEASLPEADLGPRERGRKFMIDWDKRHQEINQTETPREAFHANLQRQIRNFFGKPLERKDILSRIETLEANGQGEEAANLQANLANAIQYATIATLDVENSDRYQPTKSKTYCNIYAYDVVTALGGYLPRVWWYDSAIERLRKGEPVPVEYGRTVHEMSANRLTDWMLTFGQDYGWQRADDITAAQNTANRGKLVILLAARVNPRRKGHVTVLMPESKKFQAERGETGRVKQPLQSQAGRDNFQIQAQKRWWEGSRFRDGGAWVLENTEENPLWTPERVDDPSGERNSGEQPAQNNTKEDSSPNTVEPSSGNKAKASGVGWVSRAIERNEVFARQIGWIIYFDQIVGYFQELTLIPLLQSPSMETFTKAVSKFQTRHKLVSDGLLGPKTWRVLERHLNLQTKGQPKVTNNVNISEQFAYAIKATGQFESGGDYSATQTKDSGIISYGKYQFTLKSGNLFNLLSRWINNGSSRQEADSAWQIIHSRLSVGNSAFKEDKNLKTDQQFLSALRQAGQTPSMQSVQDDYAESVFFNPAARKAQKQGVQSNIGIAIFFDTRIQSPAGLEYCIKAMNGKTANQMGEKRYLDRFLDARINYLQRVATNQRKKAKEARKNGDLERADRLKKTAQMLDNAPKRRIEPLRKQVERQLSE